MHLFRVRFKEALWCAGCLTAGLWLAFASLEPVVGRAVDDTFIVTQTITDEISFLVTASDVSMSPAIAGLTGGTANGSTSFVILSNSASGHTVDITFSSSTAMNGNTTTGYINNYTPSSAGVPDYTFGIGGSGTPGEFAYSVTASETPTTAGIDQSFLNNGSACNTGSNSTAGNCWLNPSTTAERIITRTSITSYGTATTTIAFRVSLPANPSPVVPGDTYTATATLTAVNQ